MSEISVPVFRLNRAYHVGLFDGAHNESSLEGNCLSVSWCPDAWTSIARLGGRPTWALERAGGRFLDMCALSEPRHEQARMAILRWACTERLVETTTIFRSYYIFDEEEDEEGYFEHPSLQEALDETEEGCSPPTRHEGYRASKRLRALFGTRPLLGQGAIDFGLMAWAQAHDFDGAWWTEEYEPEALSAPRGAIFRDRVSSWPRHPVECPDDEEALVRFPRSRIEPIAPHPYTLRVPSVPRGAPLAGLSM